MKCGLTQADLGDWHALPKLSSPKPWGYTAGCPNDPTSHDRINIWPARYYGGGAGMWCRVCGARESFEDKTGECGKPFIPRHREPEIDTTLPKKMHSELLQHRTYFKERLISDEVIDLYQLGWSSAKNRYAIPCYYRGRLSAIQYRIDPVVEARLKEKGLEYAKYISETGGVNNVPFNDRIVESRPLFVFIDEAPLDALMLTSLGWPALAPFAGNSAYTGWRWPEVLNGIQEIVIIGQNDERGAEIALARRKDIGERRSRILSPPQGFKDMGEYLKTCADPMRAVYGWCGLPPVVKEKICQN